MAVGQPKGGGNATLSTMSVWIMDNLNQKAQSGIAAGVVTKANLIQTDLTNAITATESLNDSQKTNLQSQLYTFQQFYQSAGAMLQTLMQITQQFSQNMNH